MVYVISKNNKPLMPCCNVVARLLLKSGKAKVKRRTPFTIKLTYDSTEYIQVLICGVDTGSSKIGSAVVDEKNNVYYVSEIQIRNDITRKMTQRSKYRRNRQSRKVRYRQMRFLNRKNSTRKDRFSPTMRSKFDSHYKEIRFIKSILPISTLILETASFDAHVLKNPNVLKYKWMYQKGINFGYANTHAYVLDRDDYTCQYCKSRGIKLEVHHIKYRSENGSDDEKNLITLCQDCHEKEHSKEIVLKVIGKKKSNLKHATQMNSIRVQLLKKLECIETFGYITKECRRELKLPKTHYNDATAIASLGNVGIVRYKTTSILKKLCVSYRDIQKTKGVRSQMKIPTGKILGFRKFDKVKYLGKEYFIKGRMSTGYAVLMSIDSTKIEIKPIPKLVNLKRLEARKSWIMREETIPNIA